MTSASVRAGGCYVYGLVRDDGALPDVAGVGGLPLRLVPAGPGLGVAAVVSDLPAADRAMGRADLMAHSDVLQALLAGGDVVPVRFGSIYRSDDQMAGDLLGAHLGELKRLVEEMAGLVEMQAKVAYVEPAITAEIVAADRKLKKLRAASRSASGDQRTLVEMGRRFASALDARRAADGRELTRRLAKVSTATTVQDAPGDFGVAVIACLVPREGLDAFDAEVGRVQADHAGRFEMRVLGPLPPYSFVDAAGPGGR